MANVAMDMNSQNYKYFETNPHPYQGGGIDQHMLDSTQLPDPSLHASPIWRVMPHVLGFVFVYAFGGMYLNDDIFYYFPICFFIPLLLFIFICLPKQYVFDTANLPSFINNLSWGFWYGGLSLYCVLTTLNVTIPAIIPPQSTQDNHYETHNFWQQQIIFTALCLTSLVDEIVKCYLCHRSVQRFHGLGAATTSINTLLLNCALTGTGMAIAKGFLALCLLGNTNAQTTQTGDELIYDYRYALLHYIPKAFVYNDGLYPVLMAVIYGVVIVSFHSICGALWGIGFVRRFVLEHTVAFGQILMFPWFFHFIINVVIAEVFYNVVDDEFKDTSAVYTTTILVPVTVTVIAVVIFYLLFIRQIDQSISHLHSSRLNMNS
eukprot:220061_1